MYLYLLLPCVEVFFAPSRQKAYLYIILVLYSESTEKMGSVALAVS